MNAINIYTAFSVALLFVPNQMLLSKVMHRVSEKYHIPLAPQAYGFVS
jgi:hypothetical protein